MRAPTLLLLLLLARPTVGLAQGVVVTPHAVMIDHRLRTAAITLYNPGSEPAEISISTFFGYPVTDSAGDFQLATPDPAGWPSAAAWLDAYPRRMTVGPLERQTVRLLARPPAGLADGEFWSRLVISAKGGRLPVTAVGDSTPPGIRVGLDLEVRTVIPVLYRKGKLTTGLSVADLRASRQGDSLVTRARLTREGSAAFLGTAQLRLFDETGKLVSSSAIPLAVYLEVDPRMVLPITGLAAGPHRLELELSTVRTDLPPEDLLRAPAIRRTIPIVLP